MPPTSPPNCSMLCAAPLTPCLVGSGRDGPGSAGSCSGRARLRSVRLPTAACAPLARPAWRMLTCCQCAFMLLRPTSRHPPHKPVATTTGTSTQPVQPVSPWFLVVARPTLSVESYPQQQDLAAFRIPHGVFVKLHKGTWHAGGRAGRGAAGIVQCPPALGRAAKLRCARRVAVTASPWRGRDVSQGEAGTSRLCNSLAIT